MNAAIVGAGVAGLALAKGLRTIGWDIQIYEQADALKPVGAGISLTTNALRALMALGLYDAVVTAGVPICRVCVLDQQGRTLKDTDYARMTERFGHVSAIIMHRAELHRVLLAEIPASLVHTGMHCTGIVQHPDRIDLTFSAGETRSAELAFGCDGLHSALRRAIFPDAREHFARYTCWRGLAESRPPEAKLGEITESWGRGRRFGIAPLKDGRVYWFACLHARKPDDQDLAQIKLPQLKKLFSDFHAPVAEVLERTPDDSVIWNDIFDVEPLASFVQERAVLLGDAAHAVTPDLGQGACQAFEDAAVLCALLQKHSFKDAFSEYNRRRLVRTRSITRQSRHFALLAQRRSAFGARVRNFIMKAMPRQWLEREVDALLNVHFEPLAGKRG